MKHEIDLADRVFLEQCFDDCPNEMDNYTDYQRWVEMAGTERCIRQYITHDSDSGKWSGCAGFTDDDGQGWEDVAYNVPGYYESPHEILEIHNRETARVV